MLCIKLGSGTMIKSPINYMGSKFAILDKLIPLFPKTETLVDLFAGGGSVYMNVCGMYDKVIANDKIHDLIEIHKNLQNDDFVSVAISRSIETIGNKEAYSNLRDEYNTTHKPELLLALIWSCNSNMMRFNKSGQFNQTFGDRGFNDSKRVILEKYTRNVNLSNISFQSSDFFDVEIPQNSFVYIDPPYSNTEAGYNTLWCGDDKLIEYIDSLLDRSILFGISGVINEKPNPVIDFLRSKGDNIKIHTFGDLYQKVAKVKRVNQEFYATNYWSS
jgi:DNA adenine methylase Dam